MSGDGQQGCHIADIICDVIGVESIYLTSSTLALDGFSDRGDRVCEKEMLEGKVDTRYVGMIEMPSAPSQLSGDQQTTQAGSGQCNTVQTLPVVRT